MSCDKLKRVKSVKYWLSKAEDSYQKDKNMSAEINLIMAQAEMQRLKEKHTSSPLQTWGLRFGALVVAVALFSGMDLMGGAYPSRGNAVMHPGEVNMNRGVEKSVAAQPIAQEMISVASTGEEKVPLPKTSSVMMETGKKEIVYQERKEEKPVQQKEIPAAPVITPIEMQTMVGEAGRILRGQS